MTSQSTRRDQTSVFIAPGRKACGYLCVEPDEKARLELISERLRKARAKARMTQSQVARTIGTADVTISRYERGVSPPEAPIAMKLADLYGESVDWLLGRDTPAEPVTRIERDGQTHRAVEEFVASLDADELAEFREHDADWAAGLAFKDLRSTTGVEVTQSLVRRLWSERKGQRKGTIPIRQAIDVDVPENVMMLPKKPVKR